MDIYWWSIIERIWKNELVDETTVTTLWRHQWHAWTLGALPSPQSALGQSPVQPKASLVAMTIRHHWSPFVTVGFIFLQRLERAHGLSRGTNCSRSHPVAGQSPVFFNISICPVSMPSSLNHWYQHPHELCHWHPILTAQCISDSVPIHLSCRSTCISLKIDEICSKQHALEGLAWTVMRDVEILLRI